MSTGRPHSEHIELYKRHGIVPGVRVSHSIAKKRCWPVSDIGSDRPNLWGSNGRSLHYLNTVIMQLCHALCFVPMIPCVLTFIMEQTLKKRIKEVERHRRNENMMVLYEWNHVCDRFRRLKRTTNLLFVIGILLTVAGLKLTL